MYTSGNVHQVHHVHQPFDSLPVVAFVARGREIGYVFMRQRRIIRYGVKTVRGKRIGRDLSHEVSTLVLDTLARLASHGLLVLEDISHRQNSGAVNQALREMATRWDTHDYKIVRISLQAAKERLCGDPPTTHKALTEEIVSRYPLLDRLPRGFTIYHPPYWELVLLAVALGEMAAHGQRT